MSELAPGARQLPHSHISIRVPWHDRAWDGSVCDDPRANTSCLILPRIANEKDDEAEHGVRAKLWRDLPEAQWPGCRAERAAFMAPFSFTRTLSHPYAKSSPPHKHFDETPLTHPPYLKAGRPSVADRPIFLRAIAPFTPLPCSAIATRASHYLHVAAVAAPRAGSHTFRHTCVQRLVDADVPFKVIGDYVGHRSAESTLVYGKVAVHLLRQLALGDGEEAL